MTEARAGTLSNIQIEEVRREVLACNEWTPFYRALINRLCDQALAGAGMGDGLERAAKVVDSYAREAASAEGTLRGLETYCLSMAARIRALIPEVAGGAVQSNAASGNAETVQPATPAAGSSVAAPLALLREMLTTVETVPGAVFPYGWPERVRAALSASGPERRKGIERRGQLLNGLPRPFDTMAGVTRPIADRMAADRRGRRKNTPSDRRQSAPRPEGETK